MTLSNSAHTRQISLHRSGSARHGFTIVHMIAVLSLLSVFALMAAQLFAASTKAAANAASATSRQLAAQSALRLLREDVWAAGEIEVIDGRSVRLRGGSGGVIVWTLEPGSVITRQVEQLEIETPALRWEVVPQEMKFERGEMSLTLRTSIDAFERPLVFTSELLFMRSIENSGPAAGRKP